jgi:hypothetical protein
MLRDHHRFVVGAAPSYCVPHWVAEAPECCYDFTPSDVLARAADLGAAPLRLVKPGRFDGTCGGRALSHISFEAVRPAAVRVALVGSHRGLIGDAELDAAPLLLDAKHPEWEISLHAIPLDEAAAPLETDQRLGRWSFGPGCARTVGSDPYSPGEADGFSRPADSVRLVARAAGSCAIDVAYGDARTSVTVRVR